MPLNVIKPYEKPTGQRLELECETAIIGSGPAGSILAWRLAHAGVDVMVLEEGGYFTSDDFHQGELESNSHFYQEKAMRMALGDMILPIIQGRILGGSVTVNEGVVFRTPDEVLERWARDWDLKDHSPAQWKESFDEIDAIVHTEKLTLDRINTNNRLFLKACRKLGWAADTSQRNTKGCEGCGVCTLGCPIGAKQGPVETFLPMAQGLGARIAAGCRATRLETDGGRITAVSGDLMDPLADRPIGQFLVRARSFVLSAGPINSAYLLLRSGIHDDGGATGRGLKLHPTAMIQADFETEVRGYRGDPIGAWCHEFFHHRQPETGYVLEPIFIHPMMFSMVVPGFGMEHKARMKRYNHLAMMILQVHDDSTGTIREGIGGRPMVRYRLEESDKKRLIHGLQRGAEIWLEAGAREVWLPYVRPTVVKSSDELSIVGKTGIPSFGTILYSAHPQGGVAMGEREEKCAVDSHGRHRQVKNLVVCDAGSFPTSVGVNPMMSVMALADRVGRYWAENHKTL